MPQIVIQVNGAAVYCDDHAPLLSVLHLLKLNPQLIAIEYNGEILHRQFWEITLMQAGDRLEIVTIVGGG